ncbi:MAG TPA: PIN domain-containing protein [Pseudonocardiaceae bacterium]|nr:PIN domain-containing protein [Pseudonocardiaceae bacterium]
MIYLDSSALVTFTVERKNWKELKQYLHSHSDVRTCTSTIGFVETVRICDQIGSFPNLMASLTRDHAQVSLDNEIRNAAAEVPGGVRSLDAIHVASAQVLGSALTALVTYDNRMAEVARAAGLPVAMPGAEPA